MSRRRFLFIKGFEINSKKGKKTKNKIAVAFVVSYKKYFLVEKNSKKLLKNLFCFPLSDSKDIDKNFIESEFLYKTVNDWLKKKN